MSKTLLDLSGKINDSIIEVCQALSAVTQSMDLPFYMVGATARDIVLEVAYGIEPSRATRDIDFGVEVSGLEEFQALKQALVDTGYFQETRQAQRLIYKDGLPVDIVPFGNFASKDQSFVWSPPHDDTEMNILGFKEAFEHALQVRLSSAPSTEVKVASPAGWALLKIISWHDKDSPDCLKDAQDLSLILSHYCETFIIDELYEKEEALLADEDFDLEITGARLLGRNIAAIAKQQALTTICEILEQEAGEQEPFQLVQDMIQGRVKDSTNMFAHHLSLLQKLRQGLLEGSR
jgi:predicted nucleotidyltransferase